MRTKIQYHHNIYKTKYVHWLAEQLIETVMVEKATREAENTHT